MYTFSQNSWKVGWYKYSKYYLFLLVFNTLQFSFSQSNCLLYYDVFPFFDTQNQENAYDDEYLPNSLRHWNEERYLAKKQLFAQWIATADNHCLWIIRGVENKGVMQDLLQSSVQRPWRYKTVYLDNSSYLIYPKSAWKVQWIDYPWRLKKGVLITDALFKKYWLGFDKVQENYFLMPYKWEIEYSTKQYKWMLDKSFEAKELRYSFLTYSFGTSAGKPKPTYIGIHYIGGLSKNFPIKIEF